MRTNIMAIFMIFFLVFNAFSLTITDLFEALKKQPLNRINIVIEKQADIRYEKAISNFYPKIYGLASVEHYNSPTSLRPVTPAESAEIEMTHGTFPFSRDIEQIGLKANVPVFVYPLFSLAKEVAQLRKSAREKKKIALLRNEGILVVLNAGFEYLVELLKSIEARINSLNSQLVIVKRAVRIGRLPEIDVLRIQEMIDQMEIQKRQVNMKVSNTVWKIYSLTKIKLSSPVNMYLAGTVKGGRFLSLEPLEYELKAKRYEIEMKKGELYPSVYIKGTVFRKFGRGYNTDESVIRNYGKIGLYLSVPIFDKVIYSNIEEAKSDYVKARFKLEQLRTDLTATAEELKQRLKLINASIVFAKKTIKDRERLLKYAKVAFRLRRMTEDDYLRYEYALLEAQANLYSLKTQRWNVISKLAVLYGNNLERLVK